MIEEGLAQAAVLCRRFEGLYLRPYLCPAGVATVGYGSTFYEDGSRVQLTDPAITKDRAEELLVLQLRKTFLPGVLRLCPAVDTPARLGALIDFTYNLGVGALKSSTLRKRVNAADWDAVPGELLKWDKAGGRVLRGLTLRRQAEAALI